MALGCLADSQQRGTREFELETERWNQQKPALDLDFAAPGGVLSESHKPNNGPTMLHVL